MTDSSDVFWGSLFSFPHGFVSNSGSINAGKPIKASINMRTTSRLKFNEFPSGKSAENEAQRLFSWNFNRQEAGFNFNLGGY
jgi:hypothetical protein